MPTKKISKSQITSPFSAELATYATSAGSAVSCTNAASASIAATATLVATTERNSIIAAASGAALAGMPASAASATYATSAGSAVSCSTAATATNVATIERNAIINTAAAVEFSQFVNLNLVDIGSITPAVIVTWDGSAASGTGVFASDSISAALNNVYILNQAASAGGTFTTYQSLNTGVWKVLGQTSPTIIPGDWVGLSSSAVGYIFLLKRIS